MTSRLAAVAALIAIFLILMIMAGTTAFAQAVVSSPPTSPPPAPEADWAALILKSAAAAVCAAIASLVAWAQTKLPTWLSTSIDMRQTMEALDWEKYVDGALDKAFRYARLKTGTTPEALASLKEKNKFVERALNYLDEHHDDIMRYLDKNGNNVLDVIETRLVGVAPDKLFQGEDDADDSRAAKQVARKFAAPAGRA